MPPDPLLVYGTVVGVLSILCWIADSVSLEVGWLWPLSVWRASQTSAAIMTRGKSALRKNRFTNPLSAGYQPRFELLRPQKGVSTYFQAPSGTNSESNTPT